MEFVMSDIKTNAYIQSETEFSRARLKGFWETVYNLITGRRVHLLCWQFGTGTWLIGSVVSRGVQDIPINRIEGSLGRHQDFTRHFSPRSNDQNGKERWRMIYTLAVTGQGFPPVEVYKFGQQFFVKDGHHRISVAKHLGWKMVQAHVLDVPAPLVDATPPSEQANWCGGEGLCPQL